MLDLLKSLLCWLGWHSWTLIEDPYDNPSMVCEHCDTEEGLFDGRWHRADIEHILGLH